MKNLLILSSLIAVAAGYTFYTNGDAHRQGKEQPLGQTQHNKSEAPDFTFRDLSGKEHSLHDFKGNAIVLNFWAPWCAPCITEFPQMIDLAKKTPDNSVYLFLSVDEDRAGIQKFLKKYEPRALPKNVFVGTDNNMNISQTLFQTYKLPESYLITPDLKISRKIIGNSVAWDAPEMIDTINHVSSKN